MRVIFVPLLLQQFALIEIPENRKLPAQMSKRSYLRRSEHHHAGALIVEDDDAFVDADHIGCHTHAALFIGRQSIQKVLTNRKILRRGWLCLLGRESLVSYDLSYHIGLILLDSANSWALIYRSNKLRNSWSSSSQPRETSFGSPLICSLTSMML